MRFISSDMSHKKQQTATILFFSPILLYLIPADITVGEKTIVTAICVVGSLLLSYLPEEKN